MPTNDFIGFASTGSANIMSQADYAAAAEQTDGVQPGPASSALANKIWRQGANMAAALGNYIVAQGYNALDDGDIATLASALTTALSGTLAESNSRFSSTYKAYILKLPNGLMIQADIVNNNTDGNSRVDITYAEAFVNPPVIVVTGLLSGENFIYTNNSSRAVINARDSSGSTLSSGVNRVYAYIAIGRWK